MASIIVTSGQFTTVSSGTTDKPGDVQSGGELQVNLGGTIDDTTIEGGGQVYDYGVISNASGVNGFLGVDSGGVAYDVNFSRGYFNLGSDGQTFNDTVSGTIDANDDSGFLAVLNINPGGVATDTLLDQGGLEFDYGEAINTTASGRSNNIVDDGVLTYSGVNAQVSASITGYGLLDITGGITRVDVSNTDEPNFFGTFTGAAVIGAGTEMELSETNALGSGTILFTIGGGGQVVLANNTTPTEAFGDFYSGNSIVVAGGVDSAAQVGGDVVQLFYADGAEDDITVFGLVSAYTTITTGNGETIISSTLTPVIIGLGDDTSIDGNEMNYLVQPGGDVTVTDGGTLTDESAGGDYSGGDSGDASDDTMMAIRPQAAAAFARNDVTESTSALVTVQAGGSSTSGVFTSGGVEDVQSGGVSIDDKFFQSSLQIVEAGGSSYDPVFAGGTLTDNGAVYFGGAANSPASAIVYTLSGSGTITATSDTFTLSGNATAFSGTITAKASATVDVSNNATLNSSASLVFGNVILADPAIEFDASLNNLPQATVSGFTTSADIIDLRGLSFSANTTSTPFAAYDSAFITSGGATLEVISGGTSGTVNLDSGTEPGPLNLFSDNQGGTDITFSVLSAGTVPALGSQLTQASTLSNGTYTVFLTSGLTVTSGNLDPLIAQNGATVVLNGEGFAISGGAGGDTVLSATSGPVVVTSLGGSIGLDVAGGAHLTVTSNSFGGGILLTSGMLEVADSGGAGTGGISFNPTSGGHQFLEIDSAALPTSGSTFANVIDDFATMPGQYIDLGGFTFSSATTSATLSLDGSMLTVTNGGSTVDFNLVNTAFGPLNVFTDANGGTIVTADAVACYLTGTLIRTEIGERPVETLAIGEHVITLSGASRAIRWIGHRFYRGRFLASRPDHMPVRIAAGALADGVPARDLYVSPKHAMFIDGVLVPAAALANGSSITHVRGMTEVGYWHVELETHDVLLAEGAPSESFVDDNGRGMFHNADTFAALYPEAWREAAIYCAKRVEQGAVLEAIRARLAARTRASLAA